jgi:diguanylate cyclase (GGDEF)-like protein
VTRLFLLAFAYAATGWLGLQLPYAGSHITLVWLPTGLAVAALLRWGGAVWPGIYLGALLTNLSIGSSWPLAVGIAVGNTLGPLIAVRWLQRLDFHPAFDRQQDIVSFIIAASAGMAVSALGGCTNLYLAGLLPLSALGSAGLSWWMGDTVGVLLVAPLLLTLSQDNLTQLKRAPKEVLLWVLIAGLVAWLAFLHDTAYLRQPLSLAFLTLPLFAWAALRFGITGASLAGLSFSVIAAWSAATGHGAPRPAETQIHLVLLWSYMATTVLTGLLITALQAERQKAADKIKELAFFDHLTRLPNRALLLDRLSQTLAASRRDDSHGALLFIDLDNFKTLNDTLGHDMGDTLLKQVAQRLTGCVHEGDSVARLGGDEFVVMLTGLPPLPYEATRHAQVVADQILAVLNQHYALGHLAYRSTSSIGVTLFKGQQVTVDELMKQADLAMYGAKAAGRNAVRFFDPAMASAVKERAALENDLRQALQEQQFFLHYQPQMDGQGHTTGAEVLVRWQHPQRGLVPPIDFIPMAEECGLILPLGHWVLETACTQLAAWASQPALAHLSVAVNVSAHQFHQPDFVAQVLAVMRQTGANPHRLKLELTESLLVSNVEDVIDKMGALKTRGVGFSLDDFGTGYSSLAYLKRLPLDQLKIDRSFVRDVLSDPNDAAIAKTIIALAQSLGLGVIAEGVELATQRDFLANAGCHAYQGYFFSHPLAVKDFETFAQPRSPAKTARPDSTATNTVAA